MKHKVRDSQKMAGQFGPAVLITILAVVAVLIVLLRAATFVAPHAHH